MHSTNNWNIIDDILFDNRPYLMNEKIFEKTFKIIRSNAGKTFLPVHKYLTGLNLNIEAIDGSWHIIREYDDIALTTVDKNYVKNKKKYSTIRDIEEEYPQHYPKQFAHILNNKETISVEELKDYLSGLYNNEDIRNARASGIKKLVALYDYKKYGMR